MELYFSLSRRYLLLLSLVLLCVSEVEGMWHCDERGTTLSLALAQMSTFPQPRSNEVFEPESAVFSADGLLGIIVFEKYQGKKATYANIYTIEGDVLHSLKLADGHLDPFPLLGFSNRQLIYSLKDEMYVYDLVRRKVVAEKVLQEKVSSFICKDGLMVVMTLGSSANEYETSSRLLSFWEVVSFSVQFIENWARSCCRGMARVLPKEIMVCIQYFLGERIFKVASPSLESSKSYLVKPICFSPDGEWLTMAVLDMEVRCHSLLVYPLARLGRLFSRSYFDKSAKEFSGYKQEIQSSSISCDSRFVAFVTEGKIFVYDMESGRECARLITSFPIKSLFFYPDSYVLAIHYIPCLVDYGLFSTYAFLTYKNELRDVTLFLARSTDREHVLRLPKPSSLHLRTGLPETLVISKRGSTGYVFSTDVLLHYQALEREEREKRLLSPKKRSCVLM
ncbi:MAG: hypothetical protein AAF335_01245 [Bacteroidota bacterium]